MDLIFLFVVVVVVVVVAAEYGVVTVVVVVVVSYYVYDGLDIHNYSDCEVMGKALTSKNEPLIYSYKRPKKEHLFNALICPEYAC